MRSKAAKTPAHRRRSSSMATTPDRKANVALKLSLTGTFRVMDPSLISRSATARTVVTLLLLLLLLTSFGFVDDDDSVVVVLLLL